MSSDKVAVAVFIQERIWLNHWTNNRDQNLVYLSTRGSWDTDTMVPEWRRSVLVWQSWRVGNVSSRSAEVSPTSWLSHLCSKTAAKKLRFFLHLLFSDSSLQLKFQGKSQVYWKFCGQLWEREGHWRILLAITDLSVHGACCMVFASLENSNDRTTTTTFLQSDGIFSLWTFWYFQDEPSCARRSMSSSSSSLGKMAN